MYLKDIEIYAFKSFADRVKLEFEPGITAIVGPNGSGKSNITDAIRWVLGEQSVKTLRGYKMEDVIFNGSQNRRALGFAEVSITIDNSDGKLPVDYSEVKITRKLYRTGESQYFINKTPCRLKDISELLANTGLGKDGYSIIGQGKIDQILSNNPEERRLVFEEASGISKYKMRKSEAEKKLEKTQQNLNRLNDILYENKIRLEPLKQQAEKAKRYIQICEKLKKYDINLFLMDFEHIDNTLNEYTHQLALIEGDISKHQNTLDDNEKCLNKVEQNISQLNSSIEQLREYIFTKTSQIQKSQSDRALKIEQRSSCCIEQERIDDEIQKLKVDLDYTLDRQKQKQYALTRVNKQLDVYIKHKQELNEKINLFQHNIKKNEDNIDSSRDKYIQLLKRINDIKNEIERYTVLKDDLNKRKQQIDNIVLIKKQKIQQLKNNILKFESDILTKKKCLEENKSNIKKFSRLFNDKTQELTKLTDNLNSICDKIQFITSRKKLLEEMEASHQGYSQPVRLILDNSRHNLTGIYGAVGNLLSTPARLETAIETALGHNIQCIVTHTEQDAKLSIEFLKKKNAGRATFLPLSSIKKRQLSTKEKTALSMPGCIGVASELIDYDAKFKTVFDNLLGRVIIVEDLNSGIEIAKTFGYSFKIVTLEGDILNPGGSISGGSNTKKTNNILGRKRQIDHLDVSLKQLYNKRHNIEQQTKDITVALKDIESQIEALKLEQQQLTIEINSLNSSRMSEEQRLDEIYKELQNDKLELKRINENENDMKDVLEQLNKQLNKLQSQSDDVKQKIELYKNSYDISKQDSAKLNNQLTETKIKINSLTNERSVLLEDINELKETQKQLEQSIKLKEGCKIEIQTRIGQLTKDIDKYDKDIKNLHKELDCTKKSFEDLQDQLKNSVKKSKILTQQLENNKQILDKLKDEKNSLELKIAKIEVKKENLQQKIWDDYKITYSQALEFRIKDLSRQHIINEIKACKQEIKLMGEVNPAAADEYKELKQRYDFLFGQKTDLEKAKTDLESIINSTIKTMRYRFAKKFDEISTNFSIIFEKLFNGGKAELKLTDRKDLLNSGVDIIAQPPGKKLQNITLLSGGERTLTAIAILFAILKSNPAPFCVLDEIEAALDDVNVEHFNSFLQDFSKYIQFILVTHNKKTMETADVLYGISMQEVGVSKVVSLKLDKKVS